MASTVETETLPSYSKYKPKINLEVLSANAAKYMFLFNAVAFAVCFLFDLAALIEGFSQNNYIIPSSLCSNSGNISNSYFSNYSWHKVRDVITYSGNVIQTNFTGLVGWETGSQPGVCTPITLYFDVELWACNLNDGCGDSFSVKDSNIFYRDKWLYVYSKQGIRVTTDMCHLNVSKRFSFPIIPNFYQYQVIQYYIYFKYIAFASYHCKLIYYIHNFRKLCREPLSSIHTLLVLDIITIQVYFLFLIPNRFPKQYFMKTNILFKIVINSLLVL